MKVLLPSNTVDGIRICERNDRTINLNGMNGSPFGRSQATSIVVFPFDFLLERKKFIFFFYP